MRRRALIHDELFRLTWFVQVGGEEQAALDWFAKKMGMSKLVKEPSEFRLGSFSSIQEERDALIWLKEDCGTSTLTHEVMHAMNHLSDLLDCPINLASDEVYAHYAGWLANEIVLRMWHKKKVVRKKKM